MDELVQQAMAKWPNVPHCYGWLGLDARGRWYLRDRVIVPTTVPITFGGSLYEGCLRRSTSAADGGCRSTASR